MLKAHWNGYEIDSSEAAYNITVEKPAELGTLIRGLLGSGYFVRSYRLTSETSLERLRDFIAKREDTTDKTTAKLLAVIDKQIAKFNADRYTSIGVRAIGSILNYVGANAQALIEAQTFRFDLTPEQRDMREDYGSDEEFESGQEIDEDVYYSEYEIPWDGVVLGLGCSLVPASKLSPAESQIAYQAVKQNYEQFGLLDDFAAYSFGPPRDYVMEDINRRRDFSLRVRLHPDARLTIHGRWMDDGQFIFPYYEYLLDLAAEKAGAKIGYCIQ